MPKLRAEDVAARLLDSLKESPSEALEVIKDTVIDWSNRHRVSASAVWVSIWEQITATYTRSEED